MIRDILVFADDSLTSETRFALPASLARRHGARLSAVHILPHGYGYIPIEVGPAAGDIMQAQAEAARAAAASVEKRYLSQCKTHGLEGDWFVATDWYEAVHRAGRNDLVVVGQSASGLPTLLAGVRPEDIALAVGRPTLVVPVKGRFETCGERVIIAWKRTKEAGRAVHDALPLFGVNAVVTIVEVTEEDPATAARRSGSEDLRRHLARHGIKAMVETLKGRESQVCDTILARVSDLNGDLIVMGAYGHSRLRELVLGGVTRNMLRTMTVPVVMSH